MSGPTGSVCQLLCTISGPARRAAYRGAFAAEPALGLVGEVGRRHQQRAQQVAVPRLGRPVPALRHRLQLPHYPQVLTQVRRCGAQHGPSPLRAGPPALVDLGTLPLPEDEIVTQAAPPL